MVKTGRRREGTTAPSKAAESQSRMCRRRRLGWAEHAEGRGLSGAGLNLIDVWGGRQGYMDSL